MVASNLSCLYYIILYNIYIKCCEFSQKLINFIHYKYSAIRYIIWYEWLLSHQDLDFLKPPSMISIPMALLVLAHLFPSIDLPPSVKQPTIIFFSKLMWSIMVNPISLAQIFWDTVGRRKSNQGKKYARGDV